jgi:putative membrane protein
MRRAILFAGVMVAIGAIASPAIAKSDKEFLSDAIKGDNSEIALGELAAQKGTSDGVRSFGRTLVDDHRQTRDEATTLATDLEVKVSSTMTDTAQGEVEKLQRMSGTEFDKAFVDYMLLNHQKDIAEFEEKAGEGDRQVSQLAKKTLPMLQKHLQLAQTLSNH